FKRTNLIVHGELGVGKSFLVRILDDSLAANHGDALPCYLNLFFSGINGDENSIAAFPGAVLMEICVTAWTSLLKRDYSELRAATIESASALKWPDNEASKIAEIYRHLMLTRRMFQYNRENSFGATAVVKGEVKETIVNQW